MTPKNQGEQCWPAGAPTPGVEKITKPLIMRALVEYCLDQLNYTSPELSRTQRRQQARLEARELWRSGRWKEVLK